jgi:hypothetical protein
VPIIATDLPAPESAAFDKSIDVEASLGAARIV